jgi:hypothetical protein
VFVCGDGDKITAAGGLGMQNCWFGFFGKFVQYTYENQGKDGRYGVASALSKYFASSYLRLSIEGSWSLRNTSAEKSILSFRALSLSVQAFTYPKLNYLFIGPISRVSISKYKLLEFVL